MVASDRPSGRSTPGVPGRSGTAPQLLLVDGDNVLHRVRGTRDEAGLDWLLARLATWRPAATRVIVVLDGHARPERGYPVRPRSGVEVRRSGARTADATLVALLRACSPVERADSVVVSDDSAVRQEVRHAGGLARPVAWLADRLAAGAPDAGDRQGRRASGSVGVGRGPVASRAEHLARPDRDGPAGTGSSAHPGWAPGRGATRKKGNPRRGGRRRGSVSD